MDKELAVLQALWKKAASQDEPILIPHKTASDAKRRRFQLYNAVKQVKKNPQLDPALFAATEACSISFATETTLRLRKRAPDDDLLAVAAGLGIDVEAVAPAPKTKAELEAQESERRFMEQMQGKSPQIPAASPAPTLEEVMLRESQKPTEGADPKPSPGNHYYSREGSR